MLECLVGGLSGECGFGGGVGGRSLLGGFYEGTVLGGVLGDFARGVDVPLDMVYGAAVPFLGAVVNRHGLKVGGGGMLSNFNFYVMVFAPRASGKSVVNRFLGRYLRLCDARAEVEAGVGVVGGVKGVKKGVKGEGEVLRELKGALYGRMVMLSDLPTFAGFMRQKECQCSSLFAPHEGKTFLEFIMRSVRSAPNLLTEMWDGDSVRAARSSVRDYVIRDARLNMCVFSQPYYIGDFVSRELIDSGFVARVMLLLFDFSRCGSVCVDGGCVDGWCDFCGGLDEWCGGHEGLVVEPVGGLDGLLGDLYAFEGAPLLSGDVLLGEMKARFVAKSLRLGALHAVLCGRECMCEEDVLAGAEFVVLSGAYSRGIMCGGGVGGGKRAGLVEAMRVFPELCRGSVREVARVFGCSVGSVCAARAELGVLDGLDGLDVDGGGVDGVDGVVKCVK